LVAGANFVVTDHAHSLAFLDELDERERVDARFERADDSLESARTLIVGAFGLFTTHTGQRTTQSMRSLTFFTRLLGSLGLVAGVFGMNFEVELFQSGAWGFGIVVGLMVAAIGIAMAFGRARHWY